MIGVLFVVGEPPAESSSEYQGYSQAMAQARMVCFIDKQDRLTVVKDNLGVFANPDKPIFTPSQVVAAAAKYEFDQST